MKISYLGISLALVAFVVGIGVGYYLTPEYRLSMYEKTSVMDLGRPDTWLDLRYVNAMIAHHRGAMLVAQQALVESDRPEIRSLAEDILKNEPGAIAELYDWKKAWYGDTRTVVDPTVPNLGTKDQRFDLRFLNAVIAHHQAGLLMTNDVRSKSSRTEVLNNADAVENFLTTTLKILTDWREQWYSI